MGKKVLPLKLRIFTQRSKSSLLWRKREAIISKVDELLYNYWVFLAPFFSIFKVFFFFRKEEGVGAPFAFCFQEMSSRVRNISPKFFSGVNIYYLVMGFQRKEAVLFPLLSAYRHFCVCRCRRGFGLCLHASTLSTLVYIPPPSLLYLSLLILLSSFLLILYIYIYNSHHLIWIRWWI